jgi:transcriptional regulator with XRE-family HTH domain
MAKRKTRIQHAKIVERFAARLRQLRQDSGLTQLQLARAAGVALSHLSKLESGATSPGIDLLERLAQALKVQTISLLPAPEVEDVEAGRIETKQLFETLVARAGAETLLMLRLSLARYLDSPSHKR